MTVRPANGNANPNNQTAAKGWFCPACGGADVSASGLAGGDASCNICSWKGKVEDLPTFHFSHDGGTPEEVLRQLFIDVRKVLAAQQFSTSIGQLLIKWGFMEMPNGKNNEDVGKVLSRYVAGAAKAIIESVIKTRADIEKETHGQPTTDRS